MATRDDLMDDDGEAEVVEVPEYRFFKTKDRKTYKGKVAKKNATSVVLKLEGKTQPLTLPVGRLSDDDAKYVIDWSPEREIFLRQCSGLTVQQILENREYQSFEYKRRGRHIFVDGELNKKETRFMIDTGAGSSVLHVDWAKECGCVVGPMDQTVSGIGGKSFIDAKGIEQGHVIDPRTGHPTQAARVAAVICESATDSDAWATALLVEPNLQTPEDVRAL